MLIDLKMGILGTLDNFTAKFLQEIIAELRFLGLAQCCHIIQRHKRKKSKVDSDGAPCVGLRRRRRRRRDTLSKRGKDGHGIKTSE